MTREQARKFIVSRGAVCLQLDKSKKGYICPICKSGSGSNGTGITTKDKIHFTCWRGCFTNADIIDIVGLKYGLTSYNDKLFKAAEIFKITIEKNNIGYNKKNSSEVLKECSKKIEEETDYTDFFLQANSNIKKTAYHRGLSLATLNRFNVGYVENWQHPKVPGAPVSPRLIIPTSQYSYLARDTRSDLTKEQKKYSKSKVGKVRIFNFQVLKIAQTPIFVVEGELDALSIIDVGGEAIALGSVSNKKIFIDMLKDQKPTQPLIVAMDNDNSGAEITTELTKALKQFKIPFCELNVFYPHKDANEALNGNREAFRAAVEHAQNVAVQAFDFGPKHFKMEDGLYSLQNLVENMKKSDKMDFFSTGFRSLDSVLDGGFYAGLYVVGAVSSLGKTTFCLQIADSIAQLGQGVLIFSLEMARNELIAKSVSRLTLIESFREYHSKIYARTTRDILTATRYKSYGQAEKKLIQKAIASYAQFGENIYITEGIGDVGIEQIKSKVREYVELTGQFPVVVIDYLQIIAPFSMRATDKQNVDKAVLELKRLSRDYNIPVICISSFNRDNYMAPVNVSSFKESGAIEYSSDVLIGLQYADMDYRGGETTSARQMRIRRLVNDAEQNAGQGKAQRIQVKVLKNRNGSKGEVFLDFYPMFNYFSDKLDFVDFDGGNWSMAKSNYIKH